MSDLKVKIFSENTAHINPHNEVQLNTWLQSNPTVEIVHLLQSEAMILNREGDIIKSLTVTVFYREST